MIRSALLPRVRARREASRLSFVPRELSAEEHAELAAMAVRGAWDRGAEQRAADAEHFRGLMAKGDPRGYADDGPMADEQSWGGRG